MDYINNAQQPEVTPEEKSVAQEVAKIVATLPLDGQQRVRDCAWGLARGIKIGIGIGQAMAIKPV